MMVSVLTTKTIRFIVLGLLVTIIFYFQHSTAVSLSIIPGAQTTLNNEKYGAIPLSGNSTEIELNYEKDLTKQGLQCYALRCYGHFVNIHRCCPGFHCSVHIPLIGGICIRDPETIPEAYLPPQNDPEKQTPTMTQEPEGEVASKYPSFEEIPPKAENSPQPTVPTIPNNIGFIPTIPSYANLAVFP